MKVLFIRMNGKIGDSVIETFFYRELKRLFPFAIKFLLLLFFKV